MLLLLRDPFTIGKREMFALFSLTTCIYPIFYGAWAVILYLNGFWFVLLPSQLFFWVTEVGMASLLYRTTQPPWCDSTPPILYWIILTLSFLHIVLALSEGSLDGLVNGHSKRVLLRDILLMLSDLTLLVWSYWNLNFKKKLAENIWFAKRALCFGVALGAAFWCFLRVRCEGVTGTCRR